MDVKDLPKAVDNINSQVLIQTAYVQSLADKFANGATEIRVFSEDPDKWTNVSLQSFWQMQQDKLLAMMEYSGTLNSALTELQVALDAKLLGVVTPPVDK